MKEEKQMTMAEDLRSWGFALVFIGILHFVIPFLLAEWGMILIPLGVLTFIIKHRAMFIIIGGSMILVGFMNITAGLASGVKFWAIFGGFQIYWGFKEIAKFSAYRRSIAETIPETEPENAPAEVPKEI